MKGSDGKTIAGAKVALQQEALFQGQSLAEVTSDASGRYDLVGDVSCKPGTDFSDPGFVSTYLVASATGYLLQSSFAHQLRCVEQVQSIDFALPQLVVN